MKLKRKKDTFGTALRKDLKKNSFAYLLLVPVLLWYAVFCYAPMWGVLLAFKDYKPLLGFGGSPWVGLKHLILRILKYDKKIKSILS